MTYVIDWQETQSIANVVLSYVQITFYVSASAVAWFTFVVASKGLLSPVNTEYQKRVMDRLDQVATELGEEWNPESRACWIYHEQYIQEACEDVDAQYDSYLRGETRAESITIQVSPLDTRLTEQFNRWRSDPFIPTTLRNELLDFTIKRNQAYSDIFFSEIGKYRKRLVRRSQTDPRPAWHDANSPIHDRLKDAGFGFDDVAEKVDVLRLSIQAYMQRYDPRSKPASTVRVYSPSHSGMSIKSPDMRFLRKIGDEDTAI